MSTRGFTLIEMLLYVALASVVSTIVVLSIVNFGQALSELSVQEDVNQSAKVALERLVREIRNSDSVSFFGSTFDVNPGQLVLNTQGGMSSQISFQITGGRLTFTDATGAVEALTRTGVTVDTLLFEYAAASSTDAELVRVTLELSASRGSTSVNETFYTSGVLRQSY